MRHDFLLMMSHATKVYNNKPMFFISVDIEFEELQKGLDDGIQQTEFF